MLCSLRDKNYDWVKNFVDNYRMLMENNEGEWREDTLRYSIMASAVGSSSIRADVALLRGGAPLRNGA